MTAPGHSTYENSFTVTPGVTNSDEVFIAEQFVTYTWNVVQTTIQDTYQIQLQTTFADRRARPGAHDHSPGVDSDLGARPDRGHSTRRSPTMA